MNKLRIWLRENGILLCNTNPQLPALEDIGCTWQEVTELIDSHEVFYSKVFQGRTTYLSVEAYYLLKEVKKQKPLTEPARRIWELLRKSPGSETELLKEISALPSKEYQKGFDFLLKNLYVTALQNGRRLNDNWSSFLYGTAEQWESNVPNRFSCDDPRERLWEILSGVMTEKQFLYVCEIKKREGRKAL